MRRPRACFRCRGAVRSLGAGEGPLRMDLRAFPRAGNATNPSIRTQSLRGPARAGPRHPSAAAPTRFASASRSRLRSSLPLSVIGISAAGTKQTWRGSL